MWEWFPLSRVWEQSPFERKIMEDLQLRISNNMWSEWGKAVFIAKSALVSDVFTAFHHDTIYLTQPIMANGHDDSLIWY